MDAEAAVRAMLKGFRLPRPSECPADLCVAWCVLCDMTWCRYDIILSMRQEDEALRPQFYSILNTLQTFTDSRETKL